ncbi:MAG: hypothetical protein WBO10_10635 [Pyrinomonadaceae bacterium]
MYLIAAFGLLLMVISLLMIVDPAKFSRGIVGFSEKWYFHPFEIVSRFAFGVVFVIFSAQTGFPSLILAMGYMLILVSIGLLLTPPSRHRKFAVWSADKFGAWFRPLGFLSLVFGAFLIYAAFSG